MRKNDRTKRLIVAIIAIALVVMMVLSLGTAMVRGEEAEEGDSSLEAVPVSSSQEPIRSKGVYIDNIDVTNMTLSEAEKALNEHLADLKDDAIILYAGDKSATTTAGELGLDYANKKVVEEALSIGKKGNILKRFLADRTIRSNGPIVLDLDLTVDAKKVASVIRKKKETLDCEPAPNKMVLNENRVFSVLPAQEGISVNTDASAELLTQYMNETWHGGQGGVRLEAKLIESEDRSAQLRNVRNLLGTAVTYFDDTDEARKTNISIAAGNINGTVLYPGDEFSAIEVIGPTTEEYGFALGASFADDQMVETYGGGVCQVTSTLYDAVLAAELEVTERHNHTMPISYLEPGYDATMSDDSVDFRFMNSSDSPIYIEGVVEGGEVYFNIYGEETRHPSRSISFESRILTTTDYQTVYRVDTNAEFGSIMEISGKEGVQAELWKIIYKNGEYDSEEKVNTSTYSPMNHGYYVGIANADDATVNAIYNAVGSGSLDAIYSAVGNGSTIETVDIQED